MAAKKKLDLSAIKMVEIEKPFVLPELDQGAAAAVATLGSHPGFMYLAAALRNQAALLNASLKKTRFAAKEDFEFVQSGVFWCEWLESFVAKATSSAQPRPEPREMRSDELENFQKLLRNVDVVGASNTADNS